MVDKIGGVGRPPTAAAPHVPGSVPRGSQGAASVVANGLAFDHVLQHAAQSLQTAPAAQAAGVADTHRVRFSAHAQQRLAQAAVELGPGALSRLEAAVDKAGQKGGKESLILLDDLAFVVSVANRTVITAVGADRMNDNVFTNIDSVVIAKDRNSAGPLTGELAPPTDRSGAPVLAKTQS
jgi:flagellar operon protein